ncbi:MAG TPA: DUF3175 domain-containing protein [Thermoanaerobaculia bacterium]|nr:DUF3175 domain-containing protein [Thermoanaerobaculia bacterium]
MAAKRRRPTPERSQARRWTGRVTRESRALDLEDRVFTLTDPKEIAKSLRRSAERSTRRKAGPFASAMSMLTFYVNRAGKGLQPREKTKLMRAKSELRKLYGKPEPKRR